MCLAMIFQEARLAKLSELIYFNHWPIWWALWSTFWGSRFARCWFPEMTSTVSNSSPKSGTLGTYRLVLLCFMTFHYLAPGRGSPKPEAWLEQEVMWWAHPENGDLAWLQTKDLTAYLESSALAIDLALSPSLNQTQRQNLRQLINDFQKIF